MVGDDATTGVAQTTEEPPAHPISIDSGFRDGAGMVRLEAAGKGPDGPGAAASGFAESRAGPHCGEAAWDAGGEGRSIESVTRLAATCRDAEGRDAADCAGECADGVPGGAAALLSNTF